MLSVCEAAVGDPIVIRLFGVPDRLNELNVFVDPAVNRTEAGCIVFVISLNVLLPVTVNAPAPP